MIYTSHLMKRKNRNISLKLFFFVFFVIITKVTFATIPSTANGLVYFYGYPLNTEQDIQTIANTNFIHRAEISVEWKDVFKSRNEYDWSIIDKNIEVWKKAGKKVIIRIMTANSRPYCTSRKLIDDEKIRLICNGTFTDFEGKLSTDGFELMNATIGGNSSKYVEIKNNRKKTCEVLALSKEKKLNPNTDYLLQCDISKLQKINNSKPAKIHIVVQSETNPSKKLCFTGILQSDSSQLFSKEISIDSVDNYRLKLEIENAEYCQFDNLNLIRTTGRRYTHTGFPNYFSDEFKKVFRLFMKEMALRYNNNPTVDAIAVSGIGRWEEMLLNESEDPKEIQENYYRQWRAYGYTDISYLKNVVEWSMDLTKKLFPEKELILQISPMNNGYKNEDFIYRRSAAMAISKGISIKQNGMSEKYDTWASTSDPAYIMNRYRFSPIAKCYYETAGRINVNSSNAMGHPESLINRVIIDGVDNLYLYKEDILEPNVQKYFAYADSLMHNPFVSSLYCNLGAYTLANIKPNRPNFDTLTYYNNWLGLRQYSNADDSKAFIYDAVLKSKGYRTDKINPELIIDVDDRLLYNGITSAYLTIEYKDCGFDTFNVLVKSRKTGNAELLKTVSKYNTNQLKQITIVLDDILQSADNHREIKPEIILDGKSDGDEVFVGLEMEYVPLNMFETELVAENQLSANYQPIVKNDSLTTIINYKAGLPLAKAEICYYDGDFSQKSDVMCRLKYNDVVSPVSEKQYYIGGNKEWIPMPVSTYRIPEKLKFSIVNNNGVNGVYLGEDKKMAYRIFTFKTFENQPVKPDTNGFVTINDFFNSFTFEKDSTINSLKIFKLLADNSLQPIDFEVVTSKVHFAPQYPGKYKIELNNKTTQPSSVGCLSKK